MAAPVACFDTPHRSLHVHQREILLDEHGVERKRVERVLYVKNTRRPDSALVVDSLFQFDPFSTLDGKAELVPTGWMQ